MDIENMTRREVLDAKLGDEARQIPPRRFEIVLRCVARLSPSRGHGRKSSMGADAILLLPPSRERPSAHVSAP